MGTPDNINILEGPEAFAPMHRLWVDHEDAPEVAKRWLQERQITEHEYANLCQFIADGYVVLEQAVSAELLDRVWEGVTNMHLDPEKYIVRVTRFVAEHPYMPVLPPKTRVIDFHAVNADCQAAIFAGPILRFLNLIYTDAALAFQTLIFTWGSQQALHKDTAFVVVDEPQKLAASWIALEDVRPGSGELMYVPGSHHDAPFYFSEKFLTWNPARDGKVVHKTYNDYVLQEARKHNNPVQHFFPKRGDALIWHAGLSHGGAPITQQGLSRHSLVTHYCPARNYPKYFTFPGCPAYKKVFSGQACYSSRRYDLRPDSTTDRPIFMN